MSEFIWGRASVWWIWACCDQDTEWQTWGNYRTSRFHGTSSKFSFRNLGFRAIQESVADLLKPTDRLGGKERVRCLPWLVQQFRKGGFLKETRRSKRALFSYLTSERVKAASSNMYWGAWECIWRANRYNHNEIMLNGSYVNMAWMCNQNVLLSDFGSMFLEEHKRTALDVISCQD